MCDTGIFFEKDGQLLVDNRFDNPFDLGRGAASSIYSIERQRESQLKP